MPRVLLTLAILMVACVGYAALAPVAVLNLLAATGGDLLTPPVTYGTLPRQRLDVYRPSVAAPPDGYPVVVFFYGGSWNRGERANYKFVAAALASRGVMTLVADYRLYPAVRYPEFLEDSAKALAYGLENAKALGGNPKRVFVMGHSAGAYNAAMLAFDARWLRPSGHSPTELAGFIGLAGPYDFLPIVNPDVKPVFFHPDYPPGTQVFEHVSAAAPRTFLGAARTDDLVDPQRNTVGLAGRLQAVGRPVTMQLYDRVNHMTLAAAFAAPLHWLAPVLDDVVAFINTP